MDLLKNARFEVLYLEAFCLYQSTNAAIIAASLYAAIKTLQSIEAPKDEDKDEGTWKKEGYKTLMVSSKMMRSSCMILITLFILMRVVVVPIILS